MKSNCLIEAIKTKLINPSGNIIYKSGSWLRIFQMRWPHFYWYNKENDEYYHFMARLMNEPWCAQLWFEGDITELRCPRCTKERKCDTCMEGTK